MMKSIDEYNKAAELYFRDHPHLGLIEKKPFHNMDETSSILIRLGIILQNLHVGPSHKVADFGAGSCWLSLILNKLRIATFSIDVSASALDIGKKIFERDPDANLDIEHHFLQFDGYHIDLPDSSIDRIICFDAYHHFPNTETIIGEFARILVPGGIAAFAEPGKVHSQALQSLYEKNTFGILENDVYIDKVWQEAEQSGFTDLKIMPLDSAQDMLLDFKQYEKYMNGYDNLFPHDKNRFHLQGGQIFFLLKGTVVIDSRSPRRLLSRISLQHKALEKVRRGEPASLTLTITNISDCLWLAHHYPQGGFVQVGAHLEKVIPSSYSLFTKATAYKLVSYDFLRVPLPHDIKPNESFTIHPTFILPDEPGNYRITFDLVDEQVRWFAQDGSQTLSIEIMVI
jgi:SAM-dependent methyltransferase